jgi:hypothetical protein
MSETEIKTWTSSKQGVLVAGTTEFTMNIDSASASSSVVPDFSKTLTGTITFDENIPVVELRKLPIIEAKRLVYDYLQNHQGARTSDLIIELALEPDIVIDALSQLRCEGKVEGKDASTR